MDWLSDQWSQTSWSQMGSALASVGIIFGGVLPYIPQYREIHLSQNADGFSTYVCLTLLLANTLRIMFWFGHHFETPLLIQSVVMNLAMIAMIELCVRVKNRNLLVPNKNRYFIDVSENNGNCCHFQPKKFFDLDSRYFWQWTDFISYIEFMATFTVFCGILMYLFVDYPIFVETVGFLSVLTEALLGTPQLIKNYKNKSTLGMSKLMVCFWTIGDLFKTSYFLLRDAPLQFWLCGTLQVAIDLIILAQTIVYRNVYKKLAKDYIN